MIIAKVDVAKIDKSKLFKGQKGTYLDLVLIETPRSEYGDYMVCQGVSREDREKGIKGAILGNAKIINGSNKTKSTSVPKPKAADGDDDSDVPF